GTGYFPGRGGGAGCRDYLQIATTAIAGGRSTKRSEQIMGARSTRPPPSPSRKPPSRLPAPALRRSPGCPKTARAPVRLDIGGQGLYLSGHFHRWDAAVAIGPDLDDLTV